MVDHSVVTVPTMSNLLREVGIHLSVLLEYLSTSTTSVSPRSIYFVLVVVLRLFQLSFRTFIKDLVFRQVVVVKRSVPITRKETRFSTTDSSRLLGPLSRVTSVLSHSFSRPCHQWYPYDKDYFSLQYSFYCFAKHLLKRITMQTGKDKILD